MIWKSTRRFSCDQLMMRTVVGGALNINHDVCSLNESIFIKLNPPITFISARSAYWAQRRSEKLIWHKWRCSGVDNFFGFVLDAGAKFRMVACQNKKPRRWLSELAGMPQKCFFCKPSCLEVHFTCLLITNFFPTDWSVVFSLELWSVFFLGLFPACLEASHLLNWQF